jgi:hypothetical protein
MSRWTALFDELSGSRDTVDTMRHSGTIGQEAADPAIKGVIWAPPSPALGECREGLALLDPDRPPLDVPGKRWVRFITDARRLLNDGTIKEAAELGWSALDLFGCDDRAPYARIDQMGLVWLVAGSRVVSVSSSAAVIETRTGSRQTYRRRTGEPGRVLAWQLTP